MKLTASIKVACRMDQLWACTQEPSRHASWDLRFTTIDYLPKVRPEDPQRFRYATKIGLGRVVEGWGESQTKPGKGRSILKFGSENALSLIKEGAGYWDYQETAVFCSLETVYDYQTRGGLLGRWVDAFIFRPLMVWATRWSFDRLRLWLEKELKPDLSGTLWLVKVSCRTALGLVWCLEGFIPKILRVTPSEIDLVGRSGLYWGSPTATLHGLGIAEMFLGFWLLTGRREKTSVFLAMLGILGLGALVAFLEPSALANPYGGLTKNLGLLACGAAVLWLEPISPKAERARP